MRAKRLLVTGLLMLAAMCTLSTHAHEVRPAYLQITELADGAGFDVLWKQPIVQNRRLPIDPLFPEGCELRDLAQPRITNGALLHTWRASGCDLQQGTIHIQGLTVTLTDVMVRITNAEGEVASHLLRPEHPTLDLASAEPPVFSYLWVGVEHLIFGIDHVLFVVGLVLFIRQPIALLKTVTAFTVAHSITLALSVLGWVQVSQGPVEAIIALSIVFLARELMQPEAQRSRLTRGAPWVMAFVFGLLHGLGFAGALRDIGLPDDALWLSLLLFNVGLEIGQIAVIILLLALGWLASKVMQLAPIERTAALAMGSVAMFWTIDRTLLLI